MNAQRKFNNFNRLGPAHLTSLSSWPFLLNDLWGSNEEVRRKPINTDSFAAASISGTDSYVTISIDIPGVSQEDVKISLKDNTLRVFGNRVNKNDGERFLSHTETYYGEFERVFTLSPTLDLDTISASHKDGVLTITIQNKKAPEVKEHIIRINN
jgi:HSP20 family protein